MKKPSVICFVAVILATLWMPLRQLNGQAATGRPEKVSQDDLGGRLRRDKLWVKSLETAQELMGERLFKSVGMLGEYYQCKTQEISDDLGDPKKRNSEGLEKIEAELQRLEGELILDSVNIFPGAPSSPRYSYRAGGAELARKKSEELKEEIRKTVEGWRQTAESLGKKGKELDLSVEIERVLAGMPAAFETVIPDRLFEQRYGFYRAVVDERFRAAGVKPDNP